MLYCISSLVANARRRSSLVKKKNHFGNKTDSSNVIPQQNVCFHKN